MEQSKEQKNEQKVSEIPQQQNSSDQLTILSLKNQASVKPQPNNTANEQQLQAIKEDLKKKTQELPSLSNHDEFDAVTVNRDSIHRQSPSHINIRSQKLLSNAMGKRLSRLIMPSSRIKAKRMIKSRFFNNFLIFLIVLYIILIFGNVAIQDLLTDEQISHLDWLLYVEISILSFFQLEIMISAYGIGLKNYFSDKWLVFDAVVIVISIVLVIIDIEINFSSFFKGISSIIRGIFRFLRIFLLIRKMQTMKKIKTSSKVTTPADKILDLLGEIKDMQETEEILQDIQWSVEIISSNKLYEFVVSELNNQQAAQYAGLAGAQVQASEQHEQEETQLFRSQKTNRSKTKVNPQNNLQIIPNKIIQLFEKIDELSFDCWELRTFSFNQELKYLMIYLFEINDLFSSLSIDPKIFSNYFTLIQQSYQNNPYHNSMHAFDVVQTTNFFMKKIQFMDRAEVTNHELATAYIAAACHDVDHPGTNNLFQMFSQSPLALLYNDQSVLENHHVSLSFKLMQSGDNCNYLQNWSNDQFKRFREMMISIILGTDMKHHFGDIAKAKARLTAQDFNIKDKNDKLLCMNSVVHAADISNPIKEWSISFGWTQVVMEEFWNQGEQEKKLNIPVSYLCDRLTTNTAKSQIGFIDFVVLPLYEVIQNFLPDLSNYFDNFTHNKDKWMTLIDEYEKQLSKIQNQEQSIKIQ